MRSKFKWIFTLLVAFTMQFSFAQQKTVTGTVTSDGAKLPGATVSIAGTQQGAQTDENGKFSIKVNQGDVLEFSFLGKETKKVTVGASNVINVTLAGEQLIETVVIQVAYGKQKKEAITGSIAEIKSKEIAKVTTGNVVQGLVGKVAGVQIINNNGMPGDPPVVRFRGIGSINGKADPLYVVDGVPFSGDVASINSQDIESMSFLKDASAAALYGNRGANGVIIITTKKGKKGKPVFSIDSRFGFSSRAVKDYNMMESQKEYYEGYYQILKNSLQFGAGMPEAAAAAQAANELIDGPSGLAYNAYNGVPNNQVIDPLTGKLNANAGSLKYDEDWSDYLFGSGLFTQTNFNASGANGSDGSYFFSLGYEKNDGYVVNSGLEKISTRLKLDTKFLDFVKVGSNIAYTHFTQNYLDGYTGGTAYSSPFAWTRSIAPIYPVRLYDAAGTPVYDSFGNHMFDDGTGAGGSPIRPYGSIQHPYATAMNDVKKYSTDNVFASAFVEVDLFKGLSFMYSATADLNYTNDTSLDTPLYGDAVGAGGRITQTNRRVFGLTQQQFLKYDNNFGSHHVDVLLGHETYDQTSDFLSAGRSKLLLPGSPYVNHAGLLQSGDGGGTAYAIEGYLSRVNYDYNNKYYVNASLRRDGSSNFHPDRNWGTFYGFGAAWRVSQESFLNNVSWLNELKLKGSFGEQGNDDLNLTLPYVSQYTVPVTTDSTQPIGIGLNYLGNPDITWETNRNFNAGFDLSLFNRRLNIEAEYFQRKVLDMLFSTPVSPAEFGGQPTQPQNNGSMQNVGYELTISGDIVRNNNLTVTLSANATTYENEILDLNENGQPNNRIIVGNFVREEGGSVFDYYLREFAGVNPVNGNAQFYVVNATTGEKTITENYTAATRQKIDKSALADVYGGFGLNTSYKAFDLGVNFAYQFGGYGMDNIWMGSFGVDRGENIHRDLADTWTPQNTSATLPRVDTQDVNQHYGVSTLGLLKTDYVSIQNISLGYTFNSKITKSLGLQNLRFYSLVDNVHLWSKRQGYDPRLSLTGVSDSKYSLLRTVSFGVNLQF